METTKEIASASKRTYTLIVLYDMQTEYFYNVTEGISDEDAHKRLDTKANHIAWLTGSLVQQRFELGKLLGISKKQGADELFRDFKGIQDNVNYPPLSTFKKDWEEISPLLRNALVEVTDEQLEQPFDMGEMTISYFELLSFSIYREANCIGQIALWRRLLGYPAMKYN